jgi:hypothetical protein
MKPIKAIRLGETTSLSMKGKLYPPKNKVAITAAEMNILIYSAKR